MKVPINQIRSNPFQVRKHLDRERVQALADEIKALGYWGSLRARKNGSHYELCFGHRRLEALKLLKIKEVDLEILSLTDDDMAIQALVENLQREGLTDIEKAESIKSLIERFEGDGKGKPRERVAEFMGLSESRIAQLLSLTGLTQQSKKHIAAGKISGAAANVALALGGEEMITTAVKHGLPRKTIQAMQHELLAIPEPKIRERVQKAVVAGRVRDPESVRERARQVRVKTSGPAPTDLHLVIRQWTRTMEKWAGLLDEVIQYVDYMEQDTKGVAEFKTATRELIEKLKRFL